MNIGDLVRDKVIDQLGVITEIGFDDDVEEPYIVIELCDGSEVLASHEELELISCVRLEAII
jgi:hypothetical protein